MIRHTILAIAFAALPAAMAAQGGSQQQDTSRQQRGRSDASLSRNAAGSRARGGNYGLDREQIRQLQQAINDLPNCDVGEADGVMGPRTRRGIACARKETGVSGNDMQALFEALQLDFQSDDAQQGENRGDRAGDRAGNRAGNASGRDSTRARGNSGRGNRPGSQRDSTHRDSTQSGSGNNPPHR